MKTSKDKKTVDQGNDLVDSIARSIIGLQGCQLRLLADRLEALRSGPDGKSEEDRAAVDPSCNAEDGKCKERDQPDHPEDTTAFDDGRIVIDISASLPSDDADDSAVHAVRIYADTPAEAMSAAESAIEDLFGVEGPDRGSCQGRCSCAHGQPRGVLPHHSFGFSFPFFDARFVAF